MKAAKLQLQYFTLGGQKLQMVLGKNYAGAGLKPGPA